MANRRWGNSPLGGDDTLFPVPGLMQGFSESVSRSFGQLTNNVRVADPVTLFHATGGNQVQNYTTGATFQGLAPKYNYVDYNFFVGLEPAMVSAANITLKQSMATVIANAVAAGNNNCNPLFYNNDSEVLITGDTNTGLHNAINANNWYIFAGPGPYPSGAKQQNGTQTYWTNRSNQTPVGLSGVGSDWAAGSNYQQASPIWWNACELTGNGATVGNAGAAIANPNAKGIFADNQFATTRTSGQILCTSTVYASGQGTGGNAAIDTQWQAGLAQRIAKWRSLNPNLLMAGNCDWIAYSNPLYSTAVQGLYDIAYAENMMGPYIYCLANYASPNTMLARMATFRQLLSTNINARCIFSHSGGPTFGVFWPASQSSWTNSFTGTTAIPNNNGGTTIQTGNYWQAARYGFCMALMQGYGHAIGDGNSSGQIYSTTWWLDEYNKSGAQWNWFSNWNDPPQTVPWSNGVYRRQNAIATIYANPVGNGQRTITVSGHKLPNGGFSDPAVNNGAAVTQIVLQDGDGLVLLP